MSQLIIDNKIISASVKTILEQLRNETGSKYFNQIVDKGSEILTNCPYHKEGKELHPSCQFHARDDDNTLKGVCHCFTCGESLPLWSTVGYCFNEDEEYGKEWLVERFGNTIIDNDVYIPEEISFDRVQQTYMQESYLDQFSYFHPYMFQRKLTPEIIRKFRIGYDLEHNAVTFPLRDTKGNLIGISSRCVDSKYFNIELHYNHTKPVYLLDTVVKEHPNAVIVCESQIDALTAWSWGYAAVAMIGTGSDEQYKILNQTPIRSYVLMFDNDNAGRTASSVFQNKVRQDVMFTDIPVSNPLKDINDMTKEQFINHLIKNDVEKILRV